MSKREPKHIGEVMSDIAERYNKLTKTKMSKERIKQLTEEIQLLKKKLRISEQDVFRLAAEKADLQNTIKNLTLNPDPLKQTQDEIQQVTTQIETILDTNKGEVMEATKFGASLEDMIPNEARENIDPLKQTQDEG